MLRAALVEALPDGEIGLRNFEEGAKRPKGIGFRGLGFDAGCVGQRDFREASQKDAPGTVCETRAWAVWPTCGKQET